MSGSTAENLIENLKKKLVSFKLAVNALAIQLSQKKDILKAEEEKKEKAEAEVAALQRRIRLLEDDLESTDTRLTDATVKLDEASKAADESERFRRALQSRQVSDDSRIEQLQKRVQKSVKEAADAERKYHEATQKLASAEESLSKAEQRVEDAEEKIRSMESELRAITTNLKAMELNESTVSKHKQAYQATLEQLNQKLAQAEKRTEIADAEALNRQEELDRLISELDAEKDTNASLRSEMEKLFSELQNL